MRLFRYELCSFRSVLALVLLFAFIDDRVVSCAKSNRNNDDPSLDPVLVEEALEGDITRLPRTSRTVVELTTKYQRNLDNFLKRVLPMALKTSTEADLSANCLRAIHHTIIGGRQLKEWTIKLLDSSGHLLSGGIVDGTASDFGDYDSCLSLSAVRDSINTVSGQETILFKGQYCLVQFTPPQVLRLPSFQNWDRFNDTFGHRESRESSSFFDQVFRLRRGFRTSSARLGFCIPSSCSKKDLFNGLQLVVDSFEIEIQVLSCEIRSKPQWKSEHVGFFTIYGVLVALVVIGTVLDVIQRRKVESFSLRNNDCCGRFWSCFSLFASFKHFSSTESENKHSSASAFKFMAGIRVLTMSWIVLSNCYFFPYVGFFYKNKASTSSPFNKDDWFVGILANPSPAIDSLFVLSGIFLSYDRGCSWLYRGENLHLWKAFVRRVLRFLPAMIFTIWLFIIFPVIGDGPQWNELVLKNVDVCQRTWWRSLLFIQNFWSYSENCMMHTWFLAMLVQYSFFSIILIYLLYKKPFFGLLVNVAVIVGTSVMTGFENLHNKFPPNLSHSAFDIKFYENLMNREYLKTSTHIGPYCIGILVGCVLARRQKIKLNNWVLAFGWVFCAFVLCAVLSGFYRFPYAGDLYVTLSALYSATHRLGWALGIAWVAFVCATKNGGFVDSFLSWNKFVQLDRLSYFVYLLNPLIIFYFTGRARETTRYGQPEMMLNFLGIMVLTLIFSFVAYVCFQYPLGFLEKLIFVRSKNKNQEDHDQTKESPDPEAIFQMYNEAISEGRPSICSVSGFGTPSPNADDEHFPPVFTPRKASSVNFKDTPEILNENSKRKISDGSIIGPSNEQGKKRKSSLKFDTASCSSTSGALTVRPLTQRLASIEDREDVEDPKAEVGSERTSSNPLERSSSEASSSSTIQVGGANSDNNSRNGSPPRIQIDIELLEEEQELPSVINNESAVIHKESLLADNQSVTKEDNQIAETVKI